MNGGRLVATLAAALLALFFGVFAIAGTGEYGVGLVTRVTIRAAFPIFLAAYLASSLRRLWPSDATRWLLRNRRYLGISFGIAMALHLEAIWLLDLLHGDAFVVDPITLIFGGLAYVFTAAMTFTSFDHTAAWLGPRRWNALHRAGLHYVWIIFAVQWLGLASEGHLYVQALLALHLAALGTRLLARRRARSGGSQPAPATA